MAERRRVPGATVARLPLYQRILTEAAQAKLSTVSSKDLAEAAGLNAAKVRKDLSYLGSYGTRGTGYDVEFLLGRIRRELGLDRDWPIGIVGMGHLGTALANSRGFNTGGFRVAALLDNDPAKVGGRVAGLQIQPVSQLDSVLELAGVSIGVITTPPEAAQDVAEALVRAGIRSILNFAPTVLSVPERVLLRQVDLSTELRIMTFHQTRANGRVASGPVGRRRRARPGDGGRAPRLAGGPP
jgi:redox-sensing transcriptional repressor